MEGEEGFLEYYLERSPILFYIIGITFVLIATESRMYVHFVLQRANVTEVSMKYVDTLMSSRILSSTLFVIAYLILLMGGFIRALVRLLEPENPISAKTAIAISSLATVVYYILRFIIPDFLIAAVAPIVVDLSGVSDANGFTKAVEDAIKSRSEAHKTLSYVVLSFSYISTAIYLGIIRYSLYKIRGARVATYSIFFIIALLLVGAL